MFKRLLPQTVKARLQGLVGVSFCLLISTIVISTAIERSSRFFQAEELRLKAKYYGVQRGFEDEAHMATSLALVVASMPDVQKAFGFRNRQQLSDITMPFFKNEKDRLALAQFQFHTSPATSFLRLHKPKKFDDDLSSFRHTVVEVNSKKRVVSGIEKGVAGFGIRGVVPVFMDKNHIGSVEFGIKLNSKLLNSMKEVLNVDISVIVPDGQGFKYLAKTHSLTIPETSYSWLRKVMEEGEVQTRRTNREGKDFLTVYGPLRDYSDKVVGVLAIPNDISATTAAIRMNIYKMAGAGLAILVVTMTAVYYLMNFLINKPMRQLVEKFKKAGDGDLTVSMESKRLHSINCSATRDCGKKDCSSYGQECMCWERSGSFSTRVECPRILGGDFTDCRDCEIYRDSVLDEFAELSTTFNAFLGNIRRMLIDIQGSTYEMSDSSAGLSELADGMQAGTKSASGRTKAVSGAAEEMSSNMNAVQLPVKRHRQTSIWWLLPLRK